jgi:acetyltransferase-like isoleucine patch superfamily enzyme
MNVLTSLRLAWMRARLRNRCLLGADAVVYEPARIHQLAGRRESIAIGARTHIRGELLVYPGGRLTIGDDCYVGEQTRIWARQSISIGNRVLIAHLTTILDNTTHPADAEARHLHYRTILTSGHSLDADLSPLAVRIEDDAWIASHVVILRGVTVGRGAVVGAGSVVTHDVEPDSMVAGNPARLIRRLNRGG